MVNICNIDDSTIVTRYYQQDVNYLETLMLEHKTNENFNKLEIHQQLLSLGVARDTSIQKSYVPYFFFWYTVSFPVFLFFLQNPFIRMYIELYITAMFSVYLYLN